MAVPVQDTIPQSARDAVVKDTLSPPDDSSRVDAIQLLFEQSNRRQEVIDSMARNSQRQSYAVSLHNEPEPVYHIDSSHIIFSLDFPVTIPPPGFDLDLPEYSYRKPENEGTVFIKVPDDGSGDLVQEIDHYRPDGGPDAQHETWNMLSRNTQAITTGIYIWVVTSEMGEQIGKLVIIK